MPKRLLLSIDDTFDRLLQDLRVLMRDPGGAPASQCGVIRAALVRQFNALQSTEKATEFVLAHRNGRPTTIVQRAAV